MLLYTTETIWNLSTLTATPVAAETTSSAKYVVPLKDDKGSILLNVESGVKELMSSLAKKSKIEGCDIDESAYEHLPSSLTGVVMHLVVAGLKQELDISFDAEPKSLKRGGAGKAKGGGRTKLSRAKKNEILERMDMKYYLSELSAGTKTMDDITTAITEAFQEKTEWEEKGWVFVEGKTKYPEYKGEEE